MDKGILLTGTSGFLGKALVKEMLKETDKKIYALARSESAERVVIEETPWADPDRIEFLRGDITMPYCGLNRATLEKLSKEVGEIWHLAASTSFDESKRPEIELTNLTGTDNMLKVAGMFDNLDRFHYMSTAYVYGNNNKDVVLEARLNPNRTFKNPYEESKLACEQKVRDSRLPFTIIRPSILIGNSITGEAKGENRMVYGFLLGIAAAAMRQSGGAMQFWQNWQNNSREKDFTYVGGRLNVNPDTTKNIIPIDDVVNVCMGIMRDSSSLGKTYNVVNERNINLRQIVDTMQRALHVKGIEYVPNLRDDQINQDSPFEKYAFRKTAVYTPYTHISEPTWETGNVAALDLERVPMTQRLFNHLISKYMEKYMVPNGTKIGRGSGIRNAQQ